MIPPRISPRIPPQKLGDNLQMKFVSGLVVVNNYLKIIYKKPHSFQGAAPNIPNSLQAIDLGLGLENLHCRSIK